MTKTKMLFLLSIIICIESIYDANYQPNSLLFSRTPDFSFNRDSLIEKENIIRDISENNLGDKDAFFSNSENQFETKPRHLPFNQPFPQAQSISRSILFTSKNSLPKILSREFNDISQEMNKKLTNTIYNTRKANIDHDKFRELIVIKKRIVSDGKHKIVDLDVSGRVVPRNSTDNNIRLFLACVIFLLACVLFTASMKFYKNYLQIKKIEPFVQT
ncbi:hypothetical protein M153_4025000923, partial [Pseudoloma neurophilia]